MSNASSRFKKSEPVLTFDGEQTYGLMKKFDFLDPDIVRDDYIKFEVTGPYAYRPDLIAEKIYGQPSYYWVLIMYNRPPDPFDWPKVAEVIRAPSPDVVIPEL